MTTPAVETQPTGQSTSQSTQPATTPPAQTTAPVVTTPAAPVTPAPTAVQMSQEQLERLLAARSQPAAPVQQGSPQLSEAEFRKEFNVFEADSASYEATFGVVPTPAQLAAYNNHLQGVAKQAVTINRYLMDQRVKEIEAKFQPVQQTFKTQQEQAHFNEFVADYPGLKDYGALLKEVVEAARSRGMSFNTPAEAKQFVAAQAAKLLGKSVETFKVSAAPAQGQPNQATTQQSGNRSMSTTSMGGRSGSNGGAAPTQSTAERLFAGQTN